MCERRIDLAQFSKEIWRVKHTKQQTYFHQTIPFYGSCICTLWDAYTYKIFMVFEEECIFFVDRCVEREYQDLLF